MENKGTQQQIPEKKSFLDILCNCFSPSKPQNSKVAQNKSQNMMNTQTIQPLNNKGFQNQPLKKQTPNIQPPIQIPQEKLMMNDLKIRFPNAMNYLIDCIDLNQEQIKCLAKLEQQLKKQSDFRDPNNPSSKGIYMKSCEIFKSEQFCLFEIANSIDKRKRDGLGKFIQPKDVNQGGTKNSYLLGAIASLTNTYPQLIYNNFLFKKNKAGLYAVKLFVDGEWQYVITDDRFPCQNGIPVNAKPHGKQIWMMLLQKCWAKIFGSYQKTEIGTTGSGLIAITGIPISDNRMSICNDFQVHNLLVNSFRLKNVVSALCGELNLNDSEFEKSMKFILQSNYIQKKISDIGLIPKHSYSILDACNINGENVIKLRNPWGKFTWNGDWSFNSNKWTQKTRKQFNFIQNPKDGTFFMPTKKFYDYFDSFTICHVTPTNKFSTFKLQKEQLLNYITLSIDISMEGLYHFSIFQPDKRKDPSDYEYSQIFFEFDKFCRPQPNSIQNQNCTYFHSTLQRGTCQLGLQVIWKKDSYPIVINCYGPKQVTIKKIDL